MDTIINLLFKGIKKHPKTTNESITRATEFITTLLDSHDQYNKLYKDLGSLCAKEENISIHHTQVKKLIEFLNSDCYNIMFLVNSLTSKSAVCALSMYNIYYQEHNQNDKLLDYSDIRNNDLLQMVYINNGADAKAFALTTAVHYIQSTGLDFASCAGDSFHNLDQTGDVTS